MANPDQFIVDNDDEHWKALEYVRQWCEISESVDIATGHFEIGAFLALDGQWQKVDSIRLLIGGETSRKTAEVIAAALDDSIRMERQEGDPFLTGAEAVVEAIRSGKIQIRTYRRKKFHAKSYITHGRIDVVGSAALVGSSNFTRPGLTQNVELNVRFQGPEVRELQAWFDRHWQEAEQVTPELLTVLEHSVREFTPFEVYAKALHALTADAEPPDSEWEKTESEIFPLLAPYQVEAYYHLRQMAREWNGGFLTDGVGLGKTFVGLMLAEYYAVRQRKNVLVMATKTGKDAVWDPEFAERLPKLTGQFTNVQVMAHTDLQKQSAPELVEQLRGRVDVVIIDEAHNFRNHGKKGDDVDERRSRWWRMLEICRGKTVFLLTATPINNTFFDLVHQAELFTDQQDDYFAKIGVNSIQGTVAKWEKPFRVKAGQTVDLAAFEKALGENELLQAIIHQNSRKYAVASAQTAGGGEVLFPDTPGLRAVPYEIGLQYHKLLDELERAFEKSHPLFALPMYYPLAFSNDPAIDPLKENRQRQVVGLIRTTFLKRFESSVAAFAGSCLDLASKILGWIELNTDDGDSERIRLSNWRIAHQPMLTSIHERYRPSRDQDFGPIDTSDLTDEELEEYEAERLDPAEYRVGEMIEAAFEDLTQLQRFLDRIHDGAGIDDKYRCLRELIDPAVKRGAGTDSAVFAPQFRKQKVIVFTEFADTARYLHECLLRDGMEHVDRLDGSRSSNRFAMIKRFAPFYNKVSDAERAVAPELRVLISTDVLSEGVNLQDCGLLINYDLHWNPVRLMQRIGRVDRRMSKEVEARIVRAHKSLKASRGKVELRNFLPPAEIENLLGLYNRVQGKVLRISKTLGIPGGKLLTDEDMLDDVKVFAAFQEEYEGELSPIEELRLKWQRLVAADETLSDRIARLPDGISAAKKDGATPGIFVCRRVPVLTRASEDAATEDWSVDPGRIQWLLRSPEGDERAISQIDEVISSTVDTSPAVFTDKAQVRAGLRAIEVDALKQWRKDTQAPLDVRVTPKTLCWMEIR